MFPTIVYRCPGVHQCAGGTYDYAAAKDQAAFDSLIGSGWAATLPEAQGEELEVKAEDEAPATREELEVKAEELGIKVDGRKSDATLAREIAEALAA
jgi:hypothetical protein